MGVKQKRRLLIAGHLSFSILFSLFFTPPIPQYSSDTVRIATVNLNYSNKNTSEIIHFLIENKVDLIVFQEWSVINEQTDLFMNNGYTVTLSAPHKGVHGLAVFCKSNYSADAKIIQSPVPGPCRMPMVDIAFSNGKKSLSLLGVHTPPPMKACKNTTDPSIKAVFESGHDILLGDFNAFPFNKEIKVGLRNGYRDAKTGTLLSRLFLQGTWAPESWIPKLARIDYVFHKSEIEVKSFSTIHIPHSDHKGVVVDIEL